MRILSSRRAGRTSGGDRGASDEDAVTENPVTEDTATGAPDRDESAVDDDESVDSEPVEHESARSSPVRRRFAEPDHEADDAEQGAEASATDTDDTEESADAGGSPDTDETRHEVRSANRWMILGVAVLSVLTLGVLACGAWFGVQWYDARVEDRIRQQAVETAREQSINMVSVDADNIDKQMNSVLQGSTGEFHEQFKGVQKTFAQVVRKGEVSSTGKVQEVGVSKLSDDNATLLVALKATVKNSETPEEGRPSHYRFKVELERKGDRWLVSGMQFVP